MATVRGTYQASCRVGNWNEDIALEEDTIKNFLRKKDLGQLAIQLSFDLKARFDTPITTTTSNDGFVHFGDQVAIKNPGLADDVVIIPQMSRRVDNYLCLNADSSKMQKVTKVDWECGVSGDMNCIPTVRTVWRIVPIDHVGRSINSHVRFGEWFMLMPLAGEGLYLNAKMAKFNDSSKFTRHHEVNLVTQPNKTSWWQFLHRDPRQRFEFEGIPVPCNTELVINHMKTNQLLAVEDQYQFRTPFGHEYEVTVHTYKDGRKIEQGQNVFMVAMGTPADQSPLITTFQENKAAHEAELAKEQDRAVNKANGPGLQPTTDEEYPTIIPANVFKYPN